MTMTTDLPQASPIDQLLTTRTKGLRLVDPVPLSELRESLANCPRPLTDELFSWPLFTLDDAALAQNINCLAGLCAQRGVLHSPHVKTPMSAQIWARQSAAGAWAATVATPHQMRTAIDWGAHRVMLANELVDPRDAGWLVRALQANAALEVYLQIDSQFGINVLQAAGAASLANLHVLVEHGVPGGRTGVRGLAHTASLAQSIACAGLQLSGVTGYEAPAAGHDEDREGLAAWCDQLIEVARAVEEIVGTHTSTPDMIVSAGGSAYVDIVLDKLAPLGAPSPFGENVQLVIRSGAYVTHDHGRYARVNPLARLETPEPLVPAITVYTQVLSTPEPGLAFLDAGRRDLAFDIDLPIPLWYRSALTADTAGLGPRVQFAPGTIAVTELNDQHTFLGGVGTQLLKPGDIVGLGVSHPCTVFDKWRIGVVTRQDFADQPVACDIYGFDF